MNRRAICCLVAATMLAITSSLSGSEVVTLFTFSDIGKLNNGTTEPDKDLSVGMKPKLTLVEAGTTLAVPAGQSGTSLFIDAEGVGYTVVKSAAWTTGLRKSANAGLNYFLLECSTLGISDLTLSFDTMSSENIGPTGLTLEYAIAEGEFQPLDTLTLQRDGDFHPYTKALAIAAQENQARIAIRGVWSVDATGGSGRLDNLQLAGEFTNNLTRVVHYPFTASSLAAAGNATDFYVSNLEAINTQSNRFLNSATNTFSLQPLYAAMPLSSAINDNYFRFFLTPTNQVALTPTHLRVYASTGSGIGVLKGVMVVNGVAIELAQYEFDGKNIAPKTFRIPSAVGASYATPLEFRLHFVTDLGSTMRIDDLEVIGFVTEYTADTLLASFPFSGSAATNTVFHPQVEVSAITLTGTGTLGYNQNSYKSLSGAPVFTVSGWDGTSQGGYIAFNVTALRDTKVIPTQLSLYAKVGSETGTLRLSVVKESTEYPYGQLDLDVTERQYCFALPVDQAPALERGESAQIRIYGWGFEKSNTTLRIDDWQLFGIIKDLPSRGTLIILQ